METFLIYALKHLVLTVLFLASYKFWLYKRKQFTYNRFFLLFGLLASVVVPLIEIKKIVWIQWVPPMNEASEYVALVNNGPAFISLLDWIGIGLLTGSALVLIQLLFRVAVIYKIIYKSEIVQRKKPKLLVSKLAKEPFSFLQQIVFPKELYLGPNYEVILTHEKIHVKQGHSFDVLLVHLFLVFGWWNPLLWVYKKAIIENLEFLTDHLTVSKTKESKAYQYLLLQQTVPQQQLVLAHPFYHSFLKKRIMMLNANTPKKSPWASLILVPMMVGFVLLFNTKIVAQIAPPPPPIPTSVIPPPPPPRLASDTLVVGQLSSLIPPPPPMVSEMSIALSIEAASSEESLNREISFFKEYGISLSFNKIKRNSKGLITGIKAAFKSEAGTSGVYAVNGDMPISNFEFFAELDGDEKLVNAGFRAKAEEILKHFKVLRAYGGKSKTPKSLIYRQRVNDSISVSELYNTNANSSLKLIPVDSLSNYKLRGSLILGNLENQPLYIVDGKEQPSSKNIKNINPSDIESISVLKGESAVKKYGEKASNGAIEISLKKEK